jgi:hypothetical protein
MTEKEKMFIKSFENLGEDFFREYGLHEEIIYYYNLTNFIL